MLNITHSNILIETYSVNPATLEESIVSAVAQIVHSQDLDFKLSIFKDALLNCENSKTAIRRVNLNGLMKLLNQK